MSWEMASPNTATVLAAMSPDSVRILWQDTMDTFAQNADFWSKFEGPGKDNAITVINDTSVGKGLKFRVTSMAGFYNKGKSGDGTFDDTDDFAKIVINSNEVDADYVRNATSTTERTDEFMGMRNEISSGAVRELGKWMGRELSARTGMTFMLKGGADNLLYGGGKPTEATLVAADGLSYDDVLLMGEVLKPLGGRPAEIGTVNGSPVYKYNVVGTVPGLFSLKQDSDYQQVLREAAPREKVDANPLFTGGYVDLDGHRITEMNPIDGDGYSVVGSEFNAKAYLGEAIAAGTTAFAIKGGGSAAAAAITNIEYFKFFPNFAFEFLPADIHTPGATVQYLLIVNPKNATVDPGKVGMYAYTTGNNGNQITITARLGASNAGIKVSTLGGVTWNSGVWLAGAAGFAGHTDAHPIGSTIILCNALGQPIGDTIMFGAMAMLRGYGKYRNKRMNWDLEGGFQTRNFIVSVFGQALRKNVNNKYPGYVRLRHAISYPQLGLPVVV